MYKTISYRIQIYEIRCIKLFFRRENLFFRRENIFFSRDNLFLRRENSYKCRIKMFYTPHKTVLYGVCDIFLVCQAISLRLLHA